MNQNAVPMHPFPLNMPKPLELCVEGDFEKLFKLYFDEPMLRMLSFHGYQPDDYLTRNKQGFIANLTAKLEVAKNCQGYDLYSVTNFEGYQPIHYAAAHGNLTAVRKLVEKYKCSPVLNKYYIYKNSLHMACYFGHFEVVHYLVKDCGCYNVDGDKKSVPFEFLCHEVGKYCEMWQNRNVWHPKNDEHRPYFEFNDKELMGTGHLKILIFLCEFCEFKLEQTATKLVFQYILLCGDSTHLKFLESNSILLSEKELTSTSSTPFIQLSLLGNNSEILEFLLKRSAIVSDANLLVTAMECCVSDEVISLLVEKCPSSQVYATVKQGLSENTSLIAYVGYDAMHYSRTAETSQVLLAELIEKHGDSRDANKQNILHHIASSRLAYYWADYVVHRKPHLQSQPDSNGQFPLHLACSKIAERYPQDKILNLVQAVSSDCDINAQDKDGNTPLHISCTKGNWEIVQYLVYERKASVTLKNASGMIPLYFIRQQTYRVVPTDSPLLMSLDIDGRYEDGNTLLHHACSVEKIDDIKYLVHTLKANIHVTNMEGKNALHLASSWCMRSHYSHEVADIFNCLSNYKTECTLDKDGNTPLHIACSNSWDFSSSLLKYLKKKVPLSVKIFNNDGNLPIHCLLSRKPNHSVDEVSKLLLQNIDVDLPDTDGNTPLHLACQFNFENLIIYLVKSRGAMTQVRNTKGELPLHLIIKSRCENLSLIGLLLRFKSLCVQDEKGSTPLHLACSMYPPVNNIVTFLLASEHVHLGANLWSYKSCKDYVASSLRLEALDCLFSIKDHSNTTAMQLMLESMQDHPHFVLSVLKNFSLDNSYSSLCDELSLHIYFEKGLQSEDCSYYRDVIRVLLNSKNIQVKNVFGEGLLHSIFMVSSITGLSTSPPASRLHEVYCACPTQVINSPPTPLLSASKPKFVNRIFKQPSRHCGEESGTLLHIFCPKPVTHFSRQPSRHCSEESGTLLHTSRPRNRKTVNHFSRIFEQPSRHCNEESGTLFHTSRPRNRKTVNHFEEFISLIPITDELLHARNRIGETPLHVACNNYSRSTKELKFILQCKNSGNLAKAKNYSGKTALHYVCDGRWKEEAVKMMLEYDNSKELCDAQDENGLTALHIALKNKFQLAAELLLKLGSTPNMKDSYGNIPLHYAWQYPMDVVKLLPITRKDVLTLNNKKLSPIHLAVENYNVALTKYLYEQCDCNDIVHMVVVESAKLPIQVFFQKLRESNIRERCDYEERIAEMAGYLAHHRVNYTLLDFEDIAILITLMCIISFIETENYLREPLKHSVSSGKCSLRIPPYCSVDKVELMHAAAWFGRVDIIQYLIREENIDPCCTDERGRNSLWFACGCDTSFHCYIWYTSGIFCPTHVHPEMEAIQFLVETGCSIFSQDINDMVSIFTWVCNRKDLYLLKALTSVPGSANLQDSDGNTPLMIVIASWCNRFRETLTFIVESAKFLIPMSNQSLVNKEGCSALHFACRHESLLDIVKMLDPSLSFYKSHSLNSPLEIAIKYGNIKILKYLVSELNFSSKQLVQLIHRCLQEKQKHIAKFLLRKIDLNQIVEHENELPHKAIKFSILHGYRFFSDLDLSGSKLLHLACQYNIPQIIKCVANSSNVSIGDNAGDTPLHIACIYNHLTIVEILKICGANLKASNHEGNIPLHVASQYSAYKCIRALGTAECDVKNEYSGNTALHVACLNESYTSVTALASGSLCIQNCSGDTPLHIACRRGSFSIIYFLLKKFPDFHQALSITNHQDELPLQLALVSFGKHMHTCVRLHAFFELIRLTPNLIDHHQLMNLACQCKIPENYRIVQYFKSKKVPIDVPDARGRLPIHYASIDAVKLCFSQDIVNTHDKDGNTALHLACSSGQVSICKYLVQDMKCDISIPNKKGKVPLHMACNAPSFEPNICILLFRKASFVPDHRGNYPLHSLCKNFTDKALKSLLNMMDTLNVINMANTIASCPNNSGFLPIHYLCQSKERSAIDAISIMIKYTDNLNAKTLSQYTPLHFACLSGRHDIIELLAKQGQERCDVTIPTAFSNSPLHLVCKKGLLINNCAVAASAAQEKNSSSISESLNLVIPYLSVQGCINTVNDNGDTPLHLLLKKQLNDFGIVLLSTVFAHGASCNIKNAKGELPIHLACQYQNSFLVAVLLSKKCRIEEKTEHGENIFHYAFQNLLLTAGFFEYLLEVGEVSLLCEQNSDGNIPLHIYCMFLSNLDIIKVIFKKSDINHQNKDGNTPFHILLEHSQIWRCYHDKRLLCTEFIKSECDLTLPNNQGHSALDVIANNSDLNFLLKELFTFYSHASRVEELINILRFAGDKFITKLYLSEIDIVKKLLDYNIDPTPLYRAYRAFFDDEEKPLEVPINLLFIGDAMTGKTTLVNSLQKEAGLEIQELVPERTAGITLSTFHSPKYGKVTAYDFAGQREYYAGHESVMQSIIQKTPPLVLIHVKLTSPRADIKKQVEYWIKFIQNRLKGMQCHLVLVCSHADKISQEDIESLSKYIKGVVLKGVAAELVCIDCRDSKSFHMKELVTILERKTAVLRHKGITSFKAHCLYVLLTQHLRDRPFLTLNELFFLQRANTVTNRLLSLSFQELDILCEELASDGQVLLLRDKIPQNSVILQDTEVLLKKITGKLFAPKEFAIHEEVSSNTGVVLFSKLKTLFPQYDANLMLKCLCSIEYCFEVQDAVVLKELLNQTVHSPNDRYYFFPGLISAARSKNTISQNFPKSGSFCWVLKCEDQEFFTPKFVQLLLLRLVFRCTKARNISESTAHIWTNGLFWCNGDGVETMVTVIDTSKVMVFTQQCKSEYNFKLLKHRSTCIGLVRELQHEVCPSIHCKEYFTHPSHTNESIEVIASEDHVLVPMDEFFDAIRAGNEFIDYYGSFEIGDNLFDPYACLCENLVKILLLNNDYEKVSNKLMEYLTDHFYEVRHEIFIELFDISVTALNKSSCSKPVDRFLQILKQWGKKTGRTIGELRKKLNCISIFATSGLQSDAANYEWYVSSLPANARLYLEQQLDWDNEDVDRDLYEMAHHMIQWEENLSTHLGLTEVEINDIKTGCNSGNPPLQRREALKIWKQRQGLNATYGNLLKLFATAECTECAEVLCEVLKRRTDMPHR